MAEATERRRLGFAVKVVGEGGLKSHDTRRWQSDPSLGVSLELLHGVLEYMGRHGMRMYRISSDFVPYGTHPEMPRFHGQLERFSAELADVGRRARQLDIRLSLHPSQYVVLNAADAGVADKAIADLDQQAALLDGLEQGAEGVVVLHVGGVYGDREASLERFARNFGRLGEAARRRLVIENDEMSYRVEDCLRLHERIGTPIIFDHQHHRLNPGTLSAEAAARAALNSWPSAVTPKMHFSSARLDARAVGRGSAARLVPPLLRQHADYVDPWTFADFIGSLRDRRFDVMLEAKAKDQAMVKLEADMARLGRSAVLRQPAG